MEAQGNQHPKMGPVNPLWHRHLSSHRLGHQAEGLRHTHGHTHCPILYERYDNVAYCRALHLLDCSMPTCYACEYTPHNLYA